MTNPGTPRPVDLLQAIADDSIDRVRALLAAGADPDGSEPAKASPLLVAALLNRTPIALALIEYGATYPLPGSDASLAPYRPTSKGGLSDAMQCTIHFRNRKLFEALLAMPSTIAALQTSRDPSTAWLTAMEEAVTGKKWFLHEIVIACAATACEIQDDAQELGRLRKALNAFLPTVQIQYDATMDADHFRAAEPFRRAVSRPVREAGPQDTTDADQVRGVFFALLAAPLENTPEPGAIPNECIERAEAPVYLDDRESQEYTCNNTFIRHRIDDTTFADYTLFAREDWEYGNQYPLIQGTVFYTDTKEAMDAFVETRPPLDVMHDLVAAIDENDAALCISAIDRGADINLENNSRNIAPTLAAHYGADQLLAGLIQSRPDLAERFLHPTGPLAKPPLAVAVHQVTKHERPNGSCARYADLLVQSGANLEWADSEGQTPLAVACTKGDSRVLVSLLEAGADHRSIKDPSVYNPEIQSILAAWKARHAMQDILIAAKARINATLAS